MKNINESNIEELAGKEFEYDENYNISNFDFKKYKLIKHYKGYCFALNFQVHLLFFDCLNL